MLRLLHSKTAGALATWITLVAAGYTLLVKLVPEWFGQLTLPQSILLGIGSAIATTLLLAVALAVGAYGFRLLKPLPPPPPPPPVESDEMTPAQRLQKRITIIGSCRGSVIGYREEGGYFTDYIESRGPFMEIRRHLDPSFLDELDERRHTRADKIANDKLPALAKRWLDEVDKVAERWGIE